MKLEDYEKTSADRDADKKMGMKEGSKKEEAYDRKMAKKFKPFRKM